MKTILFDIDGTLADIEHRRSHLEQDRPDWKSFNAEMGADTPKGPVVSLYRSLWTAANFEIILVSGRNERSRALTEQWLIWNEIPFGQILMRQDGDNRADHIVKEEILHDLQRAGKVIEFVIDDRQQVVDMWRRNGITCLQCDVGDF
jgi:FMN phosphatase YigB (HAD superfamily)